MNPSKTILQFLFMFFLFPVIAVIIMLQMTYPYSTTTIYDTRTIEQPSIDCELQLIDEEIRLTKIIIKLTDEFMALPDTAKTQRQELLELSRAMMIRHNEIIYLLNEEENYKLNLRKNEKTKHIQ